MDSIKQRIAIAEFCGWSQIHPSERLDGQMVGYPPVNAIVGKPDEIPNYVSDLNAMHEAEKLIPFKISAIYVYCLEKITNSSEACLALVSAPAVYRAHALLVAIGKWERTPTVEKFNLSAPSKYPQLEKISNEMGSTLR